MFLVSIFVIAAKIKNKNIIRKIFYKKFYGHDFCKEHFLSGMTAAAAMQNKFVWDLSMKAKKTSNPTVRGIFQKFLNENIYLLRYHLSE